MSHIKWTDTEQIHHLRKRFNLLQNRDKTGKYKPPHVTYRAKVKLHGTNAGIQIKPNGEVLAQSRTAILGSGNDNAGFSAWVDSTQEYWKAFTDPKQIIVVYGEWCGPGIQKGTAINQIPEKSFCVFAVQCGDNLLVDPPALKAYLGSAAVAVGDTVTCIRPSNVYVIPWQPGILAVNFGHAEALQTTVDVINKMVAEVEACDPWVKEQFGVEGIGEGLVFFPTLDPLRPLPTRAWVTERLFKAKGEKHQVVKQRKAAQIDPETAASIEGFVELVLPEPRLQQGLDSVGEANMRLIGPFLKWINQDVKKECIDELEAAELDWKTVGKPLTTHARNWFMQQCNK